MALCADLSLDPCWSVSLKIENRDSSGLPMNPLTSHKKLDMSRYVQTPPVITNFTHSAQQHAVSRNQRKSAFGDATGEGCASRRLSFNVGRCMLSLSLVPPCFWLQLSALPQPALECELFEGGFFQTRQHTHRECERSDREVREKLKDTERERQRQRELERERKD